MSGAHQVVFDEATIRSRVSELAREIEAVYGDEHRLILVGLLKGSFVFLADLAREIRLPLQVDFMSVSSYGHGTTSSGSVRFEYSGRIPVAGRHVLLVEDIVDSGTTVREVVARLRAQGAESVETCTLLHKRIASGAPQPRFVGFDAPNGFLVGYGLDHAEDFRHLPYIASL